MRIPIACAVSFGVVALSAAAAPAFGALTLTAGTGATLSPFQPAHTAVGTGLLTATTISPSWTLQVQDSGAGAGHMRAAASGCSGSDAQLSSTLAVTVTSPLGGVVSAGSKPIAATPTTVASATSQLLALSQLTTSYSQVIPGSQVMLTGCIYTLTATYTLQ